MSDTAANEDASDGRNTEVTRQIAIVGSQVSGGPHTNFPLLISLSQPWLRDKAHGGDVALADGSDIYFMADSSTVLLHDLDSYDPTAGTLTAWVKVPSLSSTTMLQLHYGDAAPAPPGGSVWSAYAMVLHLDATLVDATGQSSGLVDATSGSVAAKFGRGRTFDGDNDAINAGSATVVDDVFAQGGTAEAWFFADTYGEMTFGRFFDKGHQSGWSLAVNNTTAAGSFSFVHGTEMATFGEWIGPAASVSLGTWHHLAVVFDRDTLSTDPVVYIDGAVVAGLNELVAPGVTADSDASLDLFIGNRAALDRTFDGILDEMRLSPQSRSPGWILTQYRNESDPNSFYTVLAP